MSDLEIVELPAHMRPASRFLNASRFVDLLEPCVTIRLQCALELAQVCFRDVLLCDPGCRRTTLPVVSGLPPADRLAHRSTVVRFWFFHSQAPTLEPACHPRATSEPPLRDVAALPPTVQTAGSFRTPSPPTSNDPAPLLPERRSPIDGTTASDRHISTPAHAPEVPVPLHLAAIGRLGASACTIRSQHAHASLGRTWRITLKRTGIRFPASPKHLRPTA